MENKYKLISFLDKESLAVLNVIVKKSGVRYVVKYKNRTKEKIDYKKLMETPPGFGDR